MLTRSSDSAGELIATVVEAPLLEGSITFVFVRRSGCDNCVIGKYTNLKIADVIKLSCVVGRSTLAVNGNLSSCLNLVRIVRRSSGVGQTSRLGTADFLEGGARCVARLGCWGLVVVESGSRSSSTPCGLRTGSPLLAVRLDGLSAQMT
jgi:hypothetical protein